MKHLIKAIARSAANAFTTLKQWRSCKTSDSPSEVPGFKIFTTPIAYRIHDIFSDSEDVVIEFLKEPPYGDADFIIIFKILLNQATFHYHPGHLIYNDTLYEIVYQNDDGGASTVIGKKQTKIDQETARCIITEAIRRM